jgi:hypothetical protein
MAELERALERLAHDVEWPATPALDAQVARPRRRRVALAVALVLVALGIAFAVQPARSALLRFFHLGAVTVQRVDTLPAAEERPLGAALGDPITQAAARQLLGRAFRAPAGVEPQLYASGQVVSALLATPDAVLLTELRTSGVDGDVLVKKLVGTSTDVHGVDLGFDAPAVWIRGREHVFLTPALPPRLAGNTLIWVSGGLTYRLEGKTLALALARRLAQQIEAG